MARSEQLEAILRAQYELEYCKSEDLFCAMIDMVELLKRIHEGSEDRDVLIDQFQNEVFTGESSKRTDSEYDILNGLAIDLDYYVSDPELRKEERSYYGVERLQDEVRAALRAIEGLRARVRFKS